jgi:hypothetical protein
MDVCKDFAEFEHAIKQQKRLLQDATKRQGHCPNDRKGRDAMLFEFTMALIATPTKIQSKETHLIRSSFVPPAYLPCTASLDNLKPITIGSLKLETHHRGSYLLLRAITPPKRMTGILVLVEDEHRDATLLQLYQQEENDNRPATDVVEEGSILLVQEPFFKIMASGGYGLRVDHLSDVISLAKEDPKVPQSWRPRRQEIERSAHSLKLQGNTFMEQGNYWRAIKE